MVPRAQVPGGGCVVVRGVCVWRGGGGGWGGGSGDDGILASGKKAKE